MTYLIMLGIILAILSFVFFVIEDKFYPYRSYKKGEGYLGLIGLTLIILVFVDVFAICIWGIIQNT